MESFPKDVVFLVDKSGSMSGAKLTQLKEAMGRIIEDMEFGDRFTVVAFETTHNVWSESLRSVEAVNLREAQSFLEEINADGGQYDTINNTFK